MMVMVKSEWLVRTIPVSVCPEGERLCRGPPDTLLPQDRATPIAHGSTRFYGRKNGSRPNSASRRHLTDPSRGRLGRSPGEERTPGEGGVITIFGGVSLTGIVFVCPVWGFICMVRRVFFGDGTLRSPLGIFSPVPVNFGSAVESDSVPKRQWPEPRLLLSIYSSEASF